MTIYCDVNTAYILPLLTLSQRYSVMVIEDVFVCFLAAVILLFQKHL